MGNEKYFDENVLAYDECRPTYGKEIYRDILSFAGIRKESRILEVGCGTGNATLPFLQTGARVTAVEKGENLSRFTADKFASFPNFQVINAAFEEYDTSESFDLIFSATAFHWIKSDYGYPRCHTLLQKGGVLAVFWNTPRVSGKNPALKQAIDALYAEYHPDGSNNTLDDAWYRNRRDSFEQTFQFYGFTDCSCKFYHDYRTFSADAYVRLLHTYSNHMALPEDMRKRFFACIHESIAQYGSIEIEDTIDLHMGRR